MREENAMRGDTRYNDDHGALFRLDCCETPSATKQKGERRIESAPMHCSTRYSMTYEGVLIGTGDTETVLGVHRRGTT